MRLQAKGLDRLPTATIIAITPISVKKRGNSVGMGGGRSVCQDLVSASLASWRVAGCGLATKLRNRIAVEDSIRENTEKLISERFCVS